MKPMFTTGGNQRLRTQQLKPLLHKVAEIIASSKSFPILKSFPVLFYPLLSRLILLLLLIIFMVSPFLFSQSSSEWGNEIINLSKKYNLSTEDLLIGNFQPEKIPIFKKLPKTYSANRVIYLRKEALNAFVRMANQAKKDGIILKVVSGFRSFNHQKRIWNRKYKKYTPIYPTVQERVQEILKYSSFPGTSRHHWGTDIDINSLNNNYFTKSKYGKKVKKWLDLNANRFNFYLTYTPHQERTGYNTEYWHYSYYPTASKMMHYYFLYVNPKSLKIFKDQNNLNLNYIFKEYVLGIDKLILKKMRLDGILIEID